eukprot:14499614-Heterocapsa_arctica.AAC.1
MRPSKGEKRRRGLLASRGLLILRRGPRSRSIVPGRTSTTALGAASAWTDASGTLPTTGRGIRPGERSHKSA